MKALAENAEKGSKLRKAFKRGGTEVRVARAPQLAARAPLSADIEKRMASYFARHDVDKRAAHFGNEENRSAGYVAWLLWGGEAGRDWALGNKQEIAGREEGGSR